MPNIHLTLAGPPEAAYPNGGDEAYWMGQVAGALAAVQHHHVRRLLGDGPGKGPLLPYRFPVGFARRPGTGGQRGNLEPGMPAEQCDKPLPHHAGGAYHAYTILLHLLPTPVLQFYSPYPTSMPG